MKIDMNISNAVKSADGFLSDREGMALYNLAQRGTESGCVVEIGSWKGKSTIWIAHALAHGIKFYAIDPHIGSSEHQKKGPIWTFEEFKKNIRQAGIESRVTPLVLTSEDARKKIDEPIRFLFIDGAHEYEFVHKDFKLWEPLLMDACWIAFHDYQWPGVEKTLREVFATGRFRKAYFTDYLFSMQKTTRAGWRDQLRSTWMLALGKRYCELKASGRKDWLMKAEKNFINFLRFLVSGL
ncbi:MAG TPA: class I SAM-dependent methyltransferase [Candidatus Bathyarchaeia archaeon]|nr:class I SAM-dependent methyltransferase [Candidatus Bathyarchaeia archaeon]